MLFNFAKWAKKDIDQNYNIFYQVDLYQFYRS